MTAGEILETAGAARSTVGSSSKDLEMPVSVRCQHCGQRYAVREELLGKQIKCKACGQVMSIVAQAAAPSAAAAAKPAATKPAAQVAAATARPPAARPAAAGAAKPAAAAPAKPRAAAAAGARPAAQPAQAQKTAVAQPAVAIDPLAAGPPVADPLFAQPGSFLDLLNDATLPAAAGGATAGHGVTLKSTTPSHGAKPAAKKQKTKKKKKKGSGSASIQTKTTLRMMGGVCVIFFGLVVIGLAIMKFTSDDESGTHIARGIRMTIAGFSIIGGGLKLIIG